MGIVKDVAVIVGSIRKESLNRKIAATLTELSPSTIRLRIVDIGNLTLYNPDYENDFLIPWQNFRKTIKSSDAVLFVTPEYNRSIPAPLKNAIDVGSRPYGESVWAGKPGGVITATPGAMGGFGANLHLRQCMGYLDVFMMQQPEAYIAYADQLFDSKGKVMQAAPREFLSKFMTAFGNWISKHYLKNN